MKNQITTFAFALTLSGTIALANNNNEVKENTKTALPAATPALQTPAPQNGKTMNEYNKYTPAQKAAIVELKMSK